MKMNERLFTPPATGVCSMNQEHAHSEPVQHPHAVVMGTGSDSSSTNSVSIAQQRYINLALSALGLNALRYISFHTLIQSQAIAISARSVTSRTTPTPQSHPYDQLQ